MEEIKHIKSFKIKNFKRFNEIEFSDFDLYNLFVGDNNIGKSSILEGLSFDENINQFLSNLDTLLSWRGIQVNQKKDFFNFLDLYINKYNGKSGIELEISYSNSNKKNKLSLSVKEIGNLNKNEIKKLRDNIITNINPKYCVIFTKNNVTEIFSLNVLENVGIFTNYCPSIQTGISYNEDLIDFYSENIQKSKIMQDELINNLKVLIPHIEGLEISTNIIPKKTTIMLRLKGLDSLMPVSLLGEGTIRLFRILLEIVICKNNRLMIDDIDSGIYFNRHIDYWRTIIRFAKLYNVQIFASTHSLECMKYFADALKSEDMEDYREKARIHSLIELPNGSVKSFTYKYDQFKYSLDMEHEIRG